MLKKLGIPPASLFTLGNNVDTSISRCHSGIDSRSSIDFEYRTLDNVLKSPKRTRHMRALGKIC